MRNVVFTLLVLFVLSLSCFAMGHRPDKKIVGGPCEYREYPGQATIVSVLRKTPGRDVRTASKEAYEVRFTFETDQTIHESYARVEGREFLLLLKNSSYPGAGFLRKYGIEPGRRFDCYLKAITRGTCTPVIFDFPTIDLKDYGENQK